jgi:hypothetical protein
MLISPPQPDEFAAYYASYVVRATKTSLLHTLVRQPVTLKRMLRSLPDTFLSARPDINEWSIKEVVSHMIDGERLFAFRALCFARGDTNALPGFDDKLYVENALANRRKMTDLHDEFAQLRTANLAMIRSFTHEMWGRRGIASGYEVSVRALVFIMSGHIDHHLESLRTVYLPQK